MRICCCCNYDNTLKIVDSFSLSMVNDIKLNPKLDLYFCSKCNFYYSDSGNSQLDYNKYYTDFNNYKLKNVPCDKDIRCSVYLKTILKKMNVNQILDYGSGNGVLTKLLSDEFQITEFDIGMECNNKKYDCLILSHVLEHIYDLDEFIKTITKNIDDSCFLYIEIPNAELYSELNEICPLQEINIEHINFFSKYSLNKLLIKHDFYCVEMLDDYFYLKQNKYYVIRGVFKRNTKNTNFCKYIETGLNEITSYNFDILKKYKNIYVYGCGQFLFKIINKISEFTNIINIIDDNPCYLNKKLGNIDIINYEMYNDIVNADDIILLTTLINDDIIKEKLLRIDKKMLVISVLDL